MDKAEQIQRIMAEEDGVDMSLEDIRKVIAAEKAEDRDLARKTEQAYQMMEEEVYQEHKDVIDAEVEEIMIGEGLLEASEDQRAEIRAGVIDTWFRSKDLVDD